MRRLCLPLCIIAANALGSSASAKELLPPDRPIEVVVDDYVDQRLREAQVEPVPETDDAGLFRRLSLDLLGRIPTESEWRAYVDSTDSRKRSVVVDRFLASPGFTRHQADAFDAMMMAGTRGSLRDYLARAIAENRPWDRIFREVILADQSAKGASGASEFLKQRIQDLDRLTNDVSTTFFGVNVTCAKCHDHPRVADWKQDHYFGMKSFFARSFDNDGFLGEHGYGVVKFQTTRGKEREAEPMFLTGWVVETPSGAEPSKAEQARERKQLDAAKKRKVAPPAPAFSLRAQLVAVALQPVERDFLSRAIVNRIWNQFFGSGLVMPLDQMHSASPPSHPELLDWLARDLVSHHYDLRRLIRGLVLSKAYARSSLGSEKALSDPRLFASALVRPLTPIQLARSMNVATLDPNAFPADIGLDEVEKRIAGVEGRARDLASAIARPGEDYQIGVSEALLLSNSDRTRDLLADGGDRLVGRLKPIKDPNEQVSLAVRTVLSRPVAAEELAILREFLARRSDRPVEGCRQLVWLLLTGAEFRFNY